MRTSKGELFQTKVLEKIKRRILYSITFFRKSCLLWDNVQKYGRARQATDDNIIRRMRFACLTKAIIHTLRVCNTYCFLTAAMVTRTRLSVTLYLHCLFYVQQTVRMYVSDLPLQCMFSVLAYSGGCSIPRYKYASRLHPVLYICSASRPFSVSRSIDPGLPARLLLLTDGIRDAASSF
jgi:hypothetical protein